MMKPSTIIMLTVLLTAGCPRPPQDKEPAKKPAALNPEPSEPQTPAYYLRYKIWTGVSPGAGFTFTSVKAVEVNMDKGEKRRILEYASRPDPMLPHDDEGVAKLLAKASWFDLEPGEKEELDGLIRAWLATSPPPAYNDSRGLGREDGYVEELSVTLDGKTVTTRINPRAGYALDDPLRPPWEWTELTTELFNIDPHYKKGGPPAG
ncbi:MAG: hypothetical protein ABIJ56_04955 [Pseudomonadota bacterium]